MTRFGIIAALLVVTACGNKEGAAPSKASAASKSAAPTADAAPKLRKVQPGELGEVFAELRVREEQYKLENGVYLATGASEADVWPAQPTPDDVLVGANAPATWQKLGVQVERQIHCGFVVIASPMELGPIGKQLYPDPPKAPWYYLVARCGVKAFGSRSDDPRLVPAQ